MSDTSEKPKPKRREHIERGIYRSAASTRRYEITWTDVHGKQRWRTIHGNLEDARNALAQETVRRNAGKRPLNHKLTFAQAADAWQQSSGFANLARSTQTGYLASLKHLRDHFGQTCLVAIDAKAVAEYVDTMRKAARKNERKTGFKGGTIKGHLTALSRVFTYAAKHLDCHAQNPMKLLENGERPTSVDARDKRVLGIDELHRLMGAADLQYRLIFKVAAETGCRLCEVLGLAWENIDLDAKTISFTKQIDRRGARVPLKTDSSKRSLEIPDALVAELRNHRMSRERTAPHELVFTTRSGRGFDPANIRVVFARAVERAGLGAVEDADGTIVQRAPTFHDLRHSHASALIAQGWDIAEVSGRLGHASVATTQRIYVHAFEAAKRSDGRRERLNDLYGTEDKRAQDAEQRATNVIELHARRAQGA